MIRSLLATLLVSLSVHAHAVTEIQFWHAMDGAPGEYVNQLVDKFNASQTDYKVVPVFKGGYDETLSAGRNAWLQGKSPHILQVVDVSTMNVMAEKKAIKPVHQLMVESGEPLDEKLFVPAVASFYSDAKGNLVSLPFNTSTPVFYYNKDAFKKAGLDFNKPLKTWYDVQDAGVKIYEAQATPCGLTTAWPSWVMLENVLAWHNEEFASKNNGFDGAGADLTFNTSLAMRHWSLMSSWIKARIFTYAGRRNEAEEKFVKGECAMLTSSSASYSTILRDAKFRFGVMPMPYYEDYKGSPYHSTMGGASLFALAGKPPKEYKGVAKFFAFLAKPEIQAEWHQNTGYLPVTRAAYELTRSQGFYEKYPGTDVGVQQMINKGLPLAAYSRGVRLGNYQLIRAVIDEEVEQVWQGKKPPKAGLDDAVKRGNELLRRFDKTYKP